ncbi:MAG: S1C family serine protease [Pseudomonadota bacterium]
MTILRFCILTILFIAHPAFASDSISPAVIAKTKKAIVTIQSRIAMAAYNEIGSWNGTGFITDKKQGLIVTNAHVIGPASIGTYFVTFDTGQETEAKLVYYDSWQDLAVLKVDPALVPVSAEEIAFSKDLPSMNQEVFIIGNNEGQSFSIHTGSISSLYAISGMMPQDSYIVNLNVAGGASGSPLMNSKGEAVGLEYGGAKTYGLSLKSGYITKVLDALKSGKQPTRKHMGAICNLYSLDKATQHRHFPKDVMDKYLKDFPDARNRVVAVQYTIVGSPSNDILKSGDIIWSINDIPVGPSLYTLDNAMDNSSDNIAKLVIYRDGQKISKEVSLYDVEANKVKKLLHFAGATFFEADDHVSAKSGIPLKALSLVNVQTGSSFSVIPVSFAQNDRVFYRLGVTGMSENSVSTIDELIKIVPDLIKKKFIKVDFKNYQPYFPGFDTVWISSQDHISSDITLDSIDTKPRLLRFDETKLEWTAEEVSHDK